MCVVIFTHTNETDKTMNKQEIIAAATKFQADRFAGVSVTDDQQGRMDALMLKMTAALESKDDSWFSDLDTKFFGRGDKCIAQATIRAIGPDCA
jgi:hypothetical protein